MVGQFNQMVYEYFTPSPNGEFQMQLEAIVDHRLNEMDFSTSLLNNTVDQNAVPAFNEQYGEFQKQHTEFP